MNFNFLIVDVVIKNINVKNETNLLTVQEADILNIFVNSQDLKMEKEVKEKLLNTTSNRKK